MKDIRKQIYKQTGEWVEDILGEDWEDHVEDFLEDSEWYHEGHLRGSCYFCKMD
jgi:hypothetical protein